MYDIVIPFKHSINNDLELKYALRSIERHIPEAGDVVIIGDEPNWHPRNVAVVPFADRQAVYWRDRNIAAKLLKACSLGWITENFIIFHDDNFLLDTLNPETYYHKGHNWEAAGDYKKVVDNTLEALGKDIKNYDIHAPHMVNKEVFQNAMKHLDWDKHWGYCIKTAYAIYSEIEGTEATDLKIQVPWPTIELNAMLDGRKFFSTGDSAWKPPVTNLLRQIFPHKSKYE